MYPKKPLVSSPLTAMALFQKCLHNSISLHTYSSTIDSGCIHQEVVSFFTHLNLSGPCYSLDPLNKVDLMFCSLLVKPFTAL